MTVSFFSSLFHPLTNKSHSPSFVALPSKVGGGKTGFPPPQYPTSPQHRKCMILFQESFFKCLVSFVFILFSRGWHSRIHWGDQWEEHEPRFESHSQHSLTSKIGKSFKTFKKNHFGWPFNDLYQLFLFHKAIFVRICQLFMLIQDRWGQEGHMISASCCSREEVCRCHFYRVKDRGITDIF